MVSSTVEMSVKPSEQYHTPPLLLLLFPVGDAATLGCDLFQNNIHPLRMCCSKHRFQSIVATICRLCWSSFPMYYTVLLISCVPVKLQQLVMFCNFIRSMKPSQRQQKELLDA